MQMRKLGRTDIEVSALCLGTMTWGQQNTEAEGHAQMDYAVDRGINFFDTAEMYPIPPRADTQGATERCIGTWFAARKNRSKIVLASKVSGRGQSTWLRSEGSKTSLDRKNIIEAVDKSLKRLQTDYIDLYQVHWPDRAVPLFGGDTTIFRDQRGAPEVTIAETLGVLGDLVQAGKVRAIGVSNETPWGTMEYLAGAQAGAGPRIQSIQNAYNLLNRTFEAGLAEIALRAGVGLLAYSPLGQGYLAGKYLRGARPPGARTTLFNRGQRYEKPACEPAIEKYVTLAGEVGIDPAQLALAFVTSRCFVTSNIIGATTMEQLATDIASASVVVTPELEKRLDTIHREFPNPAP